MREFVKIGFGICFICFFAIGVLLFLGHAGLAIKLANYIFAFLALNIVLRFYINE